MRKLHLLSQPMLTHALHFFVELKLQMVPHFSLWFLTGMPVVPVSISVSATTYIIQLGDILKIPKLWTAIHCAKIIEGQAWKYSQAPQACL